MELKFVDPRALKDNRDKARRSKSSPQADALLLAHLRRRHRAAACCGAGADAATAMSSMPGIVV